MATKSSSLLNLGRIICISVNYKVPSAKLAIGILQSQKYVGLGQTLGPARTFTKAEGDLS